MVKPRCCRCRRAYSLTATDVHGRSFEFVIKSWANGTEHRRVYVLEQAAPFIKAHCLAAGDAVGVCTNGSGALTILANTPEVPAPLHCCSACHVLLSSSVAWPAAADLVPSRNSTWRCRHAERLNILFAGARGHCAAGAGRHGGAAGDGGPSDGQGAAAGRCGRTSGLLHPYPALHQARQPPR